MLLTTNQLPPKEVTVEHVAISDDEFTIALTLSPVQIALGVKVFINGLLQPPSSFTVDADGVTIPVDLSIVIGDIIHVQYYEAL